MRLVIIVLGIQLFVCCQTLLGGRLDDLSVDFNIIHFGDNVYFIHSICKKTDAEKEELKVGDFILSINGVQCSGLAPNQIMKIFQKGSDRLNLLVVSRDLVVKKVVVSKDFQRTFSIYFHDVERFNREYEASFEDSYLDLP